MPEIVALLQEIAPLVEKKTLGQMSRVILGILAISGRITMLNLSRWAGKGGSYRTVQRLYHTAISWEGIHWMFFQKRLMKKGNEHIIAGDEVVVSKAGKKTHGLDRFFAGIQQQVIPGVSFFTFALVDVEEERSYPLQTTQIVKSPEEKAASKVKAAEKKQKKATEKRKPGRPKGSKNKEKPQVTLNPELLRIQTGLQNLLKTVGTTIPLQYVVLDGHFGNYPSASMVRQNGLHLISKMRWDAALYPTFSGVHRGPGPTPKYAEKICIAQMDTQYLKESTTQDKIRTEIYQGHLYNKEFAFPLNVVIIRKTNLDTQAQAHVILFSTDLTQSYDKIIKFYGLRFQIEFNFRDAKQHWGLEDFMNIKETAVTNAANLSFFMVNFTYALAQPFRQTQPDFSILDLKSYYRGCRYAIETIKLLPQKPDPILFAAILSQIASLGAIHPLLQPVSSP